VQDYGQQDTIPKGLKAPWYTSKASAHCAEKHRQHNNQPNTSTVEKIPPVPRPDGEPPRKKARVMTDETNEPEAQQAPSQTTQSGRNVRKPGWLAESIQAYPASVCGAMSAVNALDDGTLKPMWKSTSFFS
jgi:hypothetical protein